MGVYRQERIGLIPQSILRTLDRLRKQFLPEARLLALEEFRISRLRTIVALQCFLVLLTVPLLVNFFGKVFVIQPFVEYFWDGGQEEIFLNKYQASHALQEMKDFEEILFFNTLAEEEAEEEKTTKIIDPSSNKTTVLFEKQEVSFKMNAEEMVYTDEYRYKVKELTLKYNSQSIKAITDLVGDFITLLTIQILFVRMRPQTIFLKAFLLECFYSLNDAKKSVLIFFVTDLLVGYHSPKGWQLLTEFCFQHYGLPENPVFIKFLIAILPVLLDTLFKYWIFRHLNRVSPSTVVTYHALIE
uniref:Potassium/proton antiporter CemA n=1 Tax=Xylochloris irregularis TaxID=480381 RepID=A0A097KM70_9CHLO|nr:chloroplast enveloppe membrane protein [Xylochloris irregularis]AIT94291.1 chloroplast enveloppe membrane protein [Xylochloris irregularis]